MTKESTIFYECPNCNNELNMNIEPGSIALGTCRYCKLPYLVDILITVQKIEAKN